MAFSERDFMVIGRFLCGSRPLVQVETSAQSRPMKARKGFEVVAAGQVAHVGFSGGLASWDPRFEQDEADGESGSTAIDLIRHQKPPGFVSVSGAAAG